MKTIAQMDIGSMNRHNSIENHQMTSWLTTLSSEPKQYMSPEKLQNLQKSVETSEHSAQEALPSHLQWLKMTNRI